MWWRVCVFFIDSKIWNEFEMINHNHKTRFFQKIYIDKQQFNKWKMYKNVFSLKTDYTFLKNSNFNCVGFFKAHLIVNVFLVCLLIILTKFYFLICLEFFVKSRFKNVFHFCKNFICCWYHDILKRNQLMKFKK